jgi:hypothetical protein
VVDGDMDYLVMGNLMLEEGGMKPPQARPRKAALFRPGLNGCGPRLRHRKEA